MISPRLGRPIALGYVMKEHWEAGTQTIAPAQRRQYPRHGGKAPLPNLPLNSLIKFVYLSELSSG